MNNKILPMAGSLLLLVYPMFAIGFMLDRTSSFSENSICTLIGLGLAVALGLFWNIWILVTVQLEKESLETRIQVINRKAAESAKPAISTPPPSPGVRTQRGRPYPDPNKSNPSWKPR